MHRFAEFFERYAEVLRRKGLEVDGTDVSLMALGIVGLVIGIQFAASCRAKKKNGS